MLCGGRPVIVESKSPEPRCANCGWAIPLGCSSYVSDITGDVLCIPCRHRLDQQLLREQARLRVLKGGAKR